MPPACFRLPDRVVLRIDERGGVVGAEGEETTRLADEDGRKYERKLRFTLGGGRDAEVAAGPGERPAVAFDEPPSPAVEETQIWAPLTDGIGWDDVQAGALVEPAEPTRWFRRVVALLKVQPALANDAVGLFARADVDPAGRARLTDALAAAGHAEAQAALREILRGDAARADEKAWSRYVQSLSMLESPEPATVELAGSEMASREGDGRLAAATAWGALARKSDDAHRGQARSELVAAARNATSTNEQRALLGALENLGDAESFPALAAMAQAGPSRGAAVRALRRLPGEDAERLLLASVGDEDVGVQLSALYTLSRRSGIAEETIARRVAEVAKDGRIHLRAAPMALTHLERLADAGLRREALTGMRRVTSYDPELLARVDALLGVGD